MGCHSVVYIYSITHVDCCEMLKLHNIVYTKHPIFLSHLDFNTFFIRIYRCVIFYIFLKVTSLNHIKPMFFKSFFSLFLLYVDLFSLQNYL